MSTDPTLPADSVPTWYVNLAVRWSTLDPQSRHILMVLSDIADNDTAQIPPQREPSTAQLMRETGYGKDTIIRRRKHLEETGWLVLKRPTGAAMARHEPITYRLTVPAGAEPPGRPRPVPGQPAPRRSDARSAAGARRSGPGSPTATPPTEVAHSDPEDLDRGRSQRLRGVDDSDYAGSPTATPLYKEDVPTDVPGDFEKPPAAAGDAAPDRVQRLADAEEIEQAFHARYGTTSGQRRAAVRSVIITAVADNRVPREACARALVNLANSGKDVTSQNLTAELRRMRRAAGTASPPTGPSPDPATPPRRTCDVPAHAKVELTASGVCTSCAGDARAEPDRTDDGPPPTFGAIALDRGGWALADIHDPTARAELIQARRLMHRITGPDHWLDRARQLLTTADYDPSENVTLIAAAELWRRETGHRTDQTEGAPR